MRDSVIDCCHLGVVIVKDSMCYFKLLLNVFLQLSSVLSCSSGSDLCDLVVFEN